MAYSFAGLGRSLAVGPGPFERDLAAGLGRLDHRHRLGSHWTGPRTGTGTGLAG